MLCVVSINCDLGTIPHIYLHIISGSVNTENNITLDHRNVMMSSEFKVKFQTNENVFIQEYKYYLKKNKK